jgi:cation:H+ antiporter
MEKDRGRRNYKLNEMLIDILLLLTGFIVLILGANWLVSGASSLARRLKLSEMMIGLTIVAFGTSTPELVVNLVASFNGQDDVIFGNVIGSNIFNLLMILGISGMILPIVVHYKTVWREIPFALVTVLVLLLMVNTGREAGGPVLGRLEGAVLLSLFIVFNVYILHNIRTPGTGNGMDAKLDAGMEYRKADSKADRKEERKEDRKEDRFDAGTGTTRTPALSALLIITGLAFLVAGGKLVVDKSTDIATALGMSEKLIGLTIVSIGTSLPELATSVVAAFRKNSDMAIGNIIGSNIFNILLILGICSVVRPVGYNISLNQDLLILGAFTLLLFIAMFTGKRKKLDRWEAVVLAISFLGYMVYIVSRN